MIVTGLFIAGFTVLAAIVLFGLRRLGHTTDDDYLTELLWDAHHAVTDAHRTADEAEAFVRASTGWALPNYADHQERVRLEKEILDELDWADAERQRINTELRETP